MKQAAKVEFHCFVNECSDYTKIRLTVVVARDENTMSRSHVGLQTLPFIYSAVSLFA